MNCFKSVRTSHNWPVQFSKLVVFIIPVLTTAQKHFYELQKLLESEFLLPELY